MFNTLDQQVMLPSTFFKEVGSFIDNFLADNGGDPNGEQTYIRGTISQGNPDNFVDIMTPKLFNECILPQIQDAGKEFANGVASIMAQYQIEDTLEFVSEEFEEGRFGIELRVIVSAGRS